MSDDQSLYDQAVAAAKANDFASARTLLKQFLKQEPGNINAWLLGAHVVESRSDAIRCYQRVLQIDPNHAYARKKLAELQVEPVESAPVDVPKPNSAAPKTPTRGPVPPSPQPAPAKSNSSTKVVVIAAALVAVICVGILGVVFISQGGLSLGANEPPTDQELFDVMHANAQAGVDEDMDAYMATIHPGSPLYNQTEKVLKDMFAQFDLDFKFYDMTVTSLKSNEARIHFSLLTRKRSGPDFRNNIVIGTMILRPDKGVWKIYNQEVEDVQY